MRKAPDQPGGLRVVGRLHIPRLGIHVTVLVKEDNRRKPPPRPRLLLRDGPHRPVRPFPLPIWHRLRQRWGAWFETTDPRVVAAALDISPSEPGIGFPF